MKAKWNTGTRLEEIELLLIVNKSKIFQVQHDHVKVMKLVEQRCKLAVEKALLEMKALS